MGDGCGKDKRIAKENERKGGKEKHYGNLHLFRDRMVFDEKMEFGNVVAI